MDKLWAPWRMEYILMDKEAGCFLCDIARSRDDRVNLVLQRGCHCFMLLNRYPYNNGHLMIAPYRHVDSLEVMNDDERVEMMKMAATACEMLRRAIEASGFNIGLNLGASAGAGLKDHIHLHVVPRWDGDTNFMPVISNTKVIPQSLDELWLKLCASLG